MFCRYRHTRASRMKRKMATLGLSRKAPGARSGACEWKKGTKSERNASKDWGGHETCTMTGWKGGESAGRQHRTGSGAGDGKRK